MTEYAGPTGQVVVIDEDHHITPDPDPRVAELADALHRVTESLDDFMRDHPDPGSEAYGAAWTARALLAQVGAAQPDTFGEATRKGWDLDGLARALMAAHEYRIHLYRTAGMAKLPDGPPPDDHDTARADDAYARLRDTQANGGTPTWRLLLADAYHQVLNEAGDDVGMAHPSGPLARLGAIAAAWYQDVYARMEATR